MTSTSGILALRILRTAGNDPAFHPLVAVLEKDLEVRNGDVHAFFARFNKLHDIHLIVASVPAQDMIPQLRRGHL